MKRLLGFATVLSSALLLAGCPIYPSDACGDDSDCPGGYVCNAYSNTCVQTPGTGGSSGSAGSAGSAGSTSVCTAPSDCGVNETCSEGGVCFPGDCLEWGCVSGYTCDTSTGYAICVGTGGTGGSGGAAGTAGSG
ncbi:MAG: hypothetical protein U0165_20145, partial [Polyangiaceae bacterium]